MVRSFSDFFSSRIAEMKRSEIRELLKLTQKPEIISFAGGLPCPEAFPIDVVQDITKKILEEKGSIALQYGTTEGLTPLRKELAKRMNRKGVKCTHENIIITHGCQQALDLVAKVFLDPHDIVICSLPSYLGGINAFAAFRADFVGIPLENDGMNLDALEGNLRKLAKEGKKPKFVYVLPTFHNPAGVTMPAENRKRMTEILREYDVLAFEDDPYSELRYEGNQIRPLKAFDEDDEHVFYLGTFSKILAPGLRLGWAVAPTEILNSLVTAKQSTDLCTATFSQYIAYEYLHQGLVDSHIEKIKKIYGTKRNIMLESMETYFPEQATWVRPDGGMFCWATAPGVDTKGMVIKAIEQKVAYVHGAAFRFDGGGRDSMRLNFSYPTYEEVEEGIRRLGRVLKNEMESS
ncbi:MAG: PLP-dependent aminotransferase family protein [Thermoplasmata archaeon]